MSDIGWMQTTTAPNGEVYVRVRDVVEWLTVQDGLYEGGIAEDLDQLRPHTQEGAP